MAQLFEDRRIILAPMAGVTDRVFRQLCVELGAQLTYTEMVSAKGLSYANEKTNHLLILAPGEDQVSVQMFGHEPDTMAQQAKWIEDRLGERLFALDINMGCPARKIAGKGDGSALMKDPVLAGRIIEAVSGAVEHPVTVKFRRGYFEGEETCVDFARMAQDSGAAAVAVHGRYATQMYRGSADWDAIARVKAAVSIPVVGNGDVTSAADALRMRSHTGCDAVMVGRGAQGNPWIFQQIAAAFAGDPIPDQPSPAEKMALATRHARLLSEYEGKKIVRMRKHAMWYVAGMKDAAAIRRDINEAVSYEDFAALFERARIDTERALAEEGHAGTYVI